MGRLTCQKQKRKGKSEEVKRKIPPSFGKGFLVDDHEPRPLTDPLQA